MKPIAQEGAQRIVNAILKFQFRFQSMNCLDLRGSRHTLVSFLEVLAIEDLLKVDMLNKGRFSSSEIVSWFFPGPRFLFQPGANL